MLQIERLARISQICKILPQGAGASHQLPGLSNLDFLRVPDGFQGGDIEGEGEIDDTGSHRADGRTGILNLSI